MAKKDGEGPDAVRLPGDPITEPKELTLGIAAPPSAKPDTDPQPPAREPKPVAEKLVAEKPSVEAPPAKPAAAKPAEPEEDGPHNNYGVATPTGSSPDEWLKYDEDVLKAKDAYDAKKAKAAKDAGAAAATDIAPRVPEPTAPVAGADPAEPQPPAAPGAGAALAADDTFELEPGNAWTRASIVNEIATLRSVRDERDRALALFGLGSYDDLEKGWKPFLDNARANPELVPFLDKMQSDFFLRQEDPAFAEFMDASRAKYLEWRKENPGAAPAPRAATDAPAAESALAKEVRELKEQLSAREQAVQSRAAMERFAQEVKTEREGLWKTYPILAQQPELWRAITDRAVLESKKQRDATGRPATYRLTDAVRDCWPLVMTFYRNSQAATGTPAGVEAPVAVRSGGQEGTHGAQPADPMRERQFASADDAAAQWLKDHPNGFSG